MASHTFKKTEGTLSIVTVAVIRKVGNYKAMKLLEPHAHTSLAVTTGQSREVDTAASACRAGPGLQRWRERVGAELEPHSLPLH